MIILFGSHSCVFVIVCFHHPEVLQQRVAVLEQERAEFIKLKQQLEAEFNQKRAKFKELYLSKEGMREPSYIIKTKIVCVNISLC